MPVTLNSIVQQSPNQIGTELDGRIVLMSVERGSYFGLDDTGSRIWRSLTAPRRVQDVCSDLMASYQVDQATCETDVLRFLNDMEGRGLITASTA